MGKSSPPPPPTPPTAQEISAANIESAKGLSRLQRAMQFGEPLLKEGYRAINVDRPSPESTPLYETTTIDLGDTYPSIIRYNSGSGLKNHTLDIHGTIMDGPHEGQHWEDLGKRAEEYELQDIVPATQEIRQLVGWEMPDGTTEDVAYLDAEGNPVERHVAIEADFTGLGDTDLARKQWEFDKETSPVGFLR